MNFARFRLRKGRGGIFAGHSSSALWPTYARRSEPFFATTGNRNLNKNLHGE